MAIFHYFPDAKILQSKSFMIQIGYYGSMVKPSFSSGWPFLMKTVNGRQFKVLLFRVRGGTI